MTDLNFLGQLVNSMDEAVEKLEQAKEKNKVEDFNKIKSFILDLHVKIGEAITKG